MKEKILEVVDLCKEYPVKRGALLPKEIGMVHAVNHVSFTLYQGETLGIIGESGCGKTTTLRILGGFETPDKGQVIFDDVDITSLPPNKRNLNTVFQKYALFPHMSIAENIAFGLKINKKSKEYINDKIKYALKLVNLDGFENRSIDSLSGGQQQRVSIGRAIVKNPDILLCDEPTGALDYHTSKDILALIERVNQKYGNTIVIVTHNDAIKNMADQIVKLKDGQIQDVEMNAAKVPAEQLEW